MPLWSILNPTDCVDNHMRKHLRWQTCVKWTRCSSEETFGWIQEERRPHLRPDPDDLKYVGDVVELTYYQREMRT